MSILSPRQTFPNPSVPFAGTILGGLLPGEMLLLQGSVPPNADRFQVDLTCGSSVKPRADVAFHFNPRLSKNCIVCNSLQGARWGREEHHPLTAFRPGGDFEILLLVLQDRFKVAVNGVHLLEYKHRVNLERVDTVCVSGKVKMENVGVLPPTSTVSPAASLTNQDSEMKPIRSPAGDLVVPFRAELTNGFREGRSIVVRAQVNQNAESFSVNLCTSSPAPPDIVLHLNPRLLKRVFVRNSFLGGAWGAEETQLDSFPFRGGAYFELIVRCEAQCYRVAVNGLHQLEYRHRVQDVSRAALLEVLGDVSLQEVRML